MFIANHNGQGHKQAVISEIRSSKKIKAAIAYVSDAGTQAILDEIKDKNVKLICNIDLGITTLSGIEKLLRKGAEIKIYDHDSGIFHPKLWLFGDNKKLSKLLIGSANLTENGMQKNVEASVLIDTDDLIKDATRFFNYLWKNKKCSQSVQLEDIENLKNTVQNNNKIRRRAMKRLPSPKEASKKTAEQEILLDFVKQWIDTDKNIKLGGQSLWRGWYIIPDHGEIDDDRINALKLYLSHIQGNVDIRKDSTDKNWDKILEEFGKTEFKRKSHETTKRDRFVRSDKNYLVKFGWIEHPIKPNGIADKNIIRPTELGKQINKCKKLEEVKELYTKYFFEYDFLGLKIVKFTHKLLQHIEYLDLTEFNYFVTHTHTDEDLESTIRLIKIYRSLEGEKRKNFDKEFKAHFNEVKGPTARGVYTNYIKSRKHAVSAIGWCNGFALDENYRLRLSDEQ